LSTENQGSEERPRLRRSGQYQGPGGGGVRKKHGGCRGLQDLVQQSKKS